MQLQVLRLIVVAVFCVSAVAVVVAVVVVVVVVVEIVVAEVEVLLLLLVVLMVVVIGEIVGLFVVRSVGLITEIPEPMALLNLSTKSVLVGVVRYTIAR